jgi:methionyl-tRNA formyltransferase
MKTYVVAARHRWHRHVFEERISCWPERWVFLDDPARLTMEHLASLAPRYVFFPHWSWKVPAAIVAAHECVCFHESAVPYGRGGSPVQNLIARGHADTALTALRMTDEIDAGPVYLQRPLSLLGGGEEIFLRAAWLAADMMRSIADEEPRPVAQEGTPIVFTRRRPEDSRLPQEGSLEALFDHIRMLDAEGYPPAFLELGPWRLEFTRPARRTGEILADVRITRKEER